eukprot:1380228-Rhodomonas_salina.1
MGNRAYTSDRVIRQYLSSFGTVPELSVLDAWYQKHVRGTTNTCMVLSSARSSSRTWVALAKDLSWETAGTMSSGKDGEKQ